MLCEIEIGASCEVVAHDHQSLTYTVTADAEVRIDGYGLASPCTEMAPTAYVTVDLPDGCALLHQWMWPMPKRRRRSRQHSDDRWLIVCRRAATQTVDDPGRCDFRALIQSAIDSGLVLCHLDAQGVMTSESIGCKGIRWVE